MNFPPLYTCIADMEPETAAVFLYLLHEDRPSSANATMQDLADKMEAIQRKLH